MTTSAASVYCVAEAHCHTQRCRWLLDQYKIHLCLQVCATVRKRGNSKAGQTEYCIGQNVLHRIFSWAGSKRYADCMLRSKERASESILFSLEEALSMSPNITQYCYPGTPLFVCHAFSWPVFKILISAEVRLFISTKDRRSKNIDTCHATGRSYKTDSKHSTMYNIYEKRCSTLGLWFTDWWRNRFFSFFLRKRRCFEEAIMHDALGIRLNFDTSYGNLIWKHFKSKDLSVLNKKCYQVLSSNKTFALFHPPKIAF